MNIGTATFFFFLPFFLSLIAAVAFFYSKDEEVK
jgi:cbb3-type cytochrome oxidase subunit 3